MRRRHDCEPASATLLLLTSLSDLLKRDEAGRGIRMWYGLKGVYLLMTDSSSDSVSLFEKSGEEKRRRLLQRCDGGLSPRVNRPLLFVKDSKDGLCLLPSRSGTASSSASAFLFSHSFPLSLFPLSSFFSFLPAE